MTRAELLALIRRPKPTDAARIAAILRAMAEKEPEA
jgi:hypothetical protein